LIFATTCQKAKPLLGKNCAGPPLGNFQNNRPFHAQVKFFLKIFFKNFSVARAEKYAGLKFSIFDAQILRDSPL